MMGLKMRPNYVHSDHYLIQLTRQVKQGKWGAAFDSDSEAHAGAVIF